MSSHGDPEERSPEEILESYRSRGLAGEVGFGRRPAILVVDFIVGFTDADSPLASDLREELDATRRLLDAARARGIPVFFTTTAYDAECREAGLFLSKVPSLKVLQRGSRWVEVDPGLERRREEIVIEKQYASAFFGTPLSSLLSSQGLDTLILAGCTTSGCIRATAVDALQHGFRAIVAAECVGDRAPEAHRANLMDIHGKYGDVLPLARVLEWLDGLEES